MPLAAICFFYSPGGRAQGLGNAPYSMLGLGEISGNALSLNQATGDAGVATGNIMQINNLNPALWARNRATTFEFGGIGQYKRIDVSGTNQRDLAANIGFLAIAFPVGNRWTTGITLKPYSYVDYSSAARGMVAGTDFPTIYSYSGKGAVNKVAFVNGFQLGRYVNVGLEVYYLFGNIRRSSEVTVITDDPTNDNTAGLNEKVNMRNVSVRGGAAVRIPIKSDNKLFLNVGGTYTLGNDMLVRQTSTYDLTKDTFPIFVAPDTLEKEASGNIRLPSQYRMGLSLEWPLKLSVSADYEYSDWAAYRGFRNARSEQLSSVGRFSFGVDFIPKFRSTRYFDIVSYRAGVNFGPSPYSPNGNKINETNVSVGLGLPIGRGASTLGVSLVGGQRGVLVSNAVRERFARLVLSWTFTDRWFVKPQLD